MRPLANTSKKQSAMREVRTTLPPKAQQLIYTSLKRAPLPSWSKQIWTFTFNMLGGGGMDEVR